MNQSQRRPYPPRPASSLQQRPASQGQDRRSPGQSQGGYDNYRNERPARDDRHGSRYESNGGFSRGYGGREDYNPAPVQTHVKAPDEKTLNEPGKSVNMSKIAALRSLCIKATAKASSLTGLENAFKHAEIKELYVTPREGKNLIVAAPLDFQMTQGQEGEAALSAVLDVRMLSKQAMKKLREM